MTPQLDASGFVCLTLNGKVPADFMDGTAWTFADLAPFTQGYVEALFADWHRRACVLPYVKGREWPDFEPHEHHDFPASFTDVTGTRWDIVRHGREWKRTDCQTPGEFPGFSNLAPETLVRIMEDCAARLARSIRLGSTKDGADFWRARQRGGWEVTFPPLTPYLVDDGLIRLRGIG